MNVSRLGRIAGGLAAAAAVVSLSAATPASATYLGTKSVSTTGAAATCTVNTVSQFSANVTCYIYDTARDGDTVYLRTKVNQFPEVRVNWNGGANTYGVYTARRSSDSTFGYSINVCRDRSLALDNCSGWVSFG